MLSTLAKPVGRLAAWSGRSVNRRIFAAAVTVGVVTLAAKLVSALKDVLVARAFGTTADMDAFLIAFAVPSFAISVIGGSLNAALIPTYIQVRERDGREAAQRLFSSVTCGSTALLLVMCGLLALLAPGILAAFGSHAGHFNAHLARGLFYVLLPVLVASGLSTTWGAVLNAGERFALAAWTPALTSLATIAVLLAASKTWGVFTLAMGLVLGSVLELTVLGIALKRSGVSLLPRWHGLTPATRQVLRQYAPMMAGSLMMGSAPLVDQFMASRLGPGGISALNYGNKIIALLSSVCVMAMGTAVLPHFSRMVALDDWPGIHRTLRTYRRLILQVTVPLMLAVFLSSRPLIRFLFERGAFTAADTTLVANVQSLFVLQLPFFTLSILNVRLISALKRNQVLMYGTIISVVLNFVLDYVLMQVLGAPGIALATSLVYMVSFAFLTVMLGRVLRQTEGAG